jgi:hypothetical protein
MHERAGCQVPPVADWAKEQHSGGPLRIVSGLAEITNSIICDGSQKPEAANGCPVLQGCRDHSREALMRNSVPDHRSARSHGRAQELAFSS